MGAALESRPGRLAGHEAIRMVVRCEHGSTAFFVLTGSDVSANIAALDVAKIRHGRAHRCACAEAGADESPVAWAAEVGARQVTH
ncbi:MAG: hypothetical protein XU10_C0015G0008 [Chloroflexi bacterium CSP1-4]|nr:MAG: hypothetical protein XU10_C0015G0008 [Chloroflexi bacterium CSP1-4]